MMNKLLSQFKKSVVSIADKTGGTFDGERILTVRRRISAFEGSVVYNGFKISFLYHVGRGSGPKSVMSCLFYKKGDRRSVPYFMYDLMGVIDKDDLGCYTFAYLPDAEALGNAFEYLGAQISRRIDSISAVFEDSERYGDLLEQKQKDLMGFFGRDVFAQSEKMEDGARERYLARVYDVFYSTVTTRFSSGGYSLFLTGDKDGALKRYNMYRHLSSFERRLLERLRSDEPLEKNDSPNYLTDGLAAETGKGIFLPLTLSWLVLSAVFAPVFYGIYMLMTFLLGNGAVYSSAAELRNAVDVLLPAAVTAFGVSYYFRKQIVQLAARAKCSVYKRYANIIMGGNMRGPARYFLYIVVSMSIIFTMLISNHGVRFYEDKILVNPDITSLSPVGYVYGEIDMVYVFEGRNNDSGEFVEQPGTVILFSDGRVYDLTVIADNDKLEKKVFPIFEQNGIKITRAKTSAHLPPNEPSDIPVPAKT